MNYRAGHLHPGLSQGYTLFVLSASQPAALLADMQTGIIAAFDCAKKGSYQQLPVFVEYAAHSGRRVIISAHSQNILLPRPMLTLARETAAFKLFYGRAPKVFSKQQILPVDGEMLWEPGPDEKTFDKALDLQGVFLYQAAYEARTIQGYLAAAHLFDHRLYLSVFNGGQLVFQNAFDCIKTEDFLYFVLLSCIQLQINPTDLQLRLCGQTDQLEQQLLKMYLPPAQPMTRHASVPESITDPLQGEYYPLLNALLCV